MRSNHYLLMFAFLVFTCLFTVSSLTAQELPDSKLPFVQNPNPHVINSVFDTPLEETFGSNAFTFGPAGLRGRGNVFHCTTARKLIEHRLYLNPSSPAIMYFLVYEGATFNGVYNLVSSVQLTGQGPGEGFYSSGAIDYDLQAGMFYLIYVQWDVNANYYNNQGVTPYPVPCSFGEQYAGIGWNWVPTYGDPPPATQTCGESENEGVSYYQTIVTDDIVPVELTSFTFNVSGNDVNLNWVTATETNNLGFEVQRKTGEEFSTIAFINGYGTTTESHSYSFTDKNLQPGAYTYRLKQVDLDGSFYYYNQLTAEVDAPVSFNLAQNYPNPFNPSTKIAYNLAVDSKVNLTVYNLLGESVATLLNENVPAGSHEVSFDAANLNSGVYFYRIDAVGIDGQNFSQVKKMTLTK